MSSGHLKDSQTCAKYSHIRCNTINTERASVCSVTLTVCHSVGCPGTVTRHSAAQTLTRELVKVPAGALHLIARGFITSRLRNKEREREGRGEGIESMCEGRLLQAFLSLTFSVPSQPSSLNECLHHRRPGSRPAARQGTTHFSHPFTLLICPIFTKSPEERVLNRCTKCISMNRANSRGVHRENNNI